MFTRGNKAVINIFNKNIIAPQWHANIDNHNTAKSIWIMIPTISDQFTADEISSLNNNMIGQSFSVTLAQNNTVIFTNTVKLSFIAINTDYINLMFNP